MAAPVPGGPSAAKGKKCAPCRLVARICTFIRHAATGGNNAARVGAQSSVAVPRSTPAATDATDEKAAARAANAQPGRGGGGALLPRFMRVHEERVRRLGARFGIEYPPSFWPAAGGTAAGVDDAADEAVVRLHKPIRVRVRRSCHKCQTVFGPGSRECAACQHIRCKACGRQPPRHGDPEMQKLAAARDARDRQVAAAAVALLMRNGDLGGNAGSEGASRSSSSRHSGGSSSSSTPLVAGPVQTEVPTRPRTPPLMLTVPSRTGGADLVYRKPRQRVRRSCCQCRQVFPTGRRACAGEGCVHLRCPDCPREPPSRLWYAGAVADDDEGAAPPPSQHRCHLCRTKYPLNAPEATVCVACAHPRCDTCPRIIMPLRRRTPAPAPAPPGVPTTSAAAAPPALDAQLANLTLNG